MYTLNLLLGFYNNHCSVFNKTITPLMHNRGSKALLSEQFTSISCIDSKQRLMSFDWNWINLRGHIDVICSYIYHMNVMSYFFLCLLLYIFVVVMEQNLKLKLCVKKNFFLCRLVAFDADTTPWSWIHLATNFNKNFNKQGVVSMPHLMRLLYRSEGMIL